MQLAITGATGGVGQLVLKRFEEKKIAVRALVRDLEKAKSFNWQQATLCRFDYSDPQTFEAALKEIDKLVVIANSADNHLAQFLKQGKLKQVVVISGVSAERYPNMPLALLEKAVYSTALPFTCLRLNWFMQNFTTFLADEIKNQQQISLPAADAKTSFIDVRDVADVIVKVLEESSDYYINKAFSLTGGEALSYSDAAGLISHALGRQVDYKPISDEEGYFKFIDMGFGKDSAAQMVELFRGVKAGTAEKASPWVEKILKRPPRTFTAFAKESSTLSRWL